VRRPEPPSDPLSKARKSFVAIHDHAVHGLRDGAETDVVDAVRHLSLIRLMAQHAINTIDGRGADNAV
jgi:hypothetical protein